MKTKNGFATVGLLLAMILTSSAQSSSKTTHTDVGAALDFTIATCRTPDGGSLLGGNSEINGTTDFRIVRTDKSGNIKWDRTYGGDRVDELTTLEPATDGGYIIGGRSNSGISGDKSQYTLGKYDFWIVKIDGNGHVEWDRTYGGYEKDNLVAIKQLADGVIVLAGYSNSNKYLVQHRDSDYMVLWIDQRGELLKQQLYGQSGKDILSSMVLLSDGGILLGGYSQEDNLPEFEYVLLKLDRFGSELWTKSVGSASDEYLATLEGIENVQDGGFILHGDHAAGNWVIKFDLEGNRSYIDTTINNMIAIVKNN